MEPVEHSPSQRSAVMALTGFAVPRNILRSMLLSLPLYITHCTTFLLTLHPHRSINAQRIIIWKHSHYYRED